LLIKPRYQKTAVYSSLPAEAVTTSSIRVIAQLMLPYEEKS